MPPNHPKLVHGLLPPSENSCVRVRRYMTPLAMAGQKRGHSPFLRSSLWRPEGAKRCMSPFPPPDFALWRRRRFHAPPGEFGVEDQAG